MDINKENIVQNISISTIQNTIPSIEKKNYHLEQNLEDERYSFPLIMRKSHIYKEMDVFVIESWRSFNELQQIINEWFKNNKDVTNEISFIFKEKPNIEATGSVVSKLGYQMICIKKKIYTRLNVSIYDNIVRQTQQEDYISLKETMKLLAELVPEFQEDFSDKIAQRGKYNELVDIWRKDEENYEDNGDGLTWINFTNKGDSMLHDRIKLNLFDGMLDDEFGFINQDIAKCFVTINRKNKELLNMNKDLLEKCSKLSEIDLQKAQLKEMNEYIFELEEKMRHKERQVTIFEETCKLKEIKEKNQAEDLNKFKEINEIRKNEIESLKQRLSAFETNNKQDKSEMIIFDVDSGDMRSKEDLKNDLGELRIDLSLLKEIISEQKELDYESTNIDTAQKQTMIKVLQDKLNKRDVYINKIDSFLVSLIKLEEEILMDDTNKLVFEEYIGNFCLNFFYKIQNVVTTHKIPRKTVQTR